MSEQPKIGEVGWFDLTVECAEAIRDFYREVVGWSSADHPMDDYNDYVMQSAGGQAVAGICHARGANADLPAQWLIYVTVADLEASMRNCASHGGAIVAGPRDLGSYGRLCVIRDPAGAVIALMQPPPA